MNGTPRLVEVRQNVLKQNDLVARSLRERFRAAGVYVVSFVSSPGSGKMALLERTLTTLRSRHRVAAVVGDLADAVEFDWARANASVQAVRPGMDVLPLSTKSGEGFDAYLQYLESRLRDLRVMAGASPS